MAGLVDDYLPNPPRPDGRCGPSFGNAGCDTKSNYPCCSNYGWCGNGAGFCDTNVCKGQAPSPTNAPPSGGSGIAKYFPRHLFDQKFPTRNPTYSYDRLLSVAAKFGSFGNTGNVDNDKREVAAFFAHVTHETGSLVYTEEIAKTGPYAPYIGRGALQLTWQANYQAFGNAIGRDLVANYASVATDPDLVWWSALWFWHANKIHDVAGQWGQFAKTTQIINGNIECGHNPANPSGDPARVAHFKAICADLGVDPGTNLSCKY
ncbi:hypothetical protein ACHHYP_04485 [Achlya hypogyna]|uniref:Chitin-binding type-1 domain-containing protein n=1 Tax=Achlya hypogyna TaxID=1202772 RepID=A0A1V9Z0X8_ACHHY|nr:hypothetical protein ACHHYP_04485 [Achlya hypogyna]